MNSLEQDTQAEIQTIEKESLPLTYEVRIYFNILIY